MPPSRLISRLDNVMYKLQQEVESEKGKDATGPFRSGETQLRITGKLFTYMPTQRWESMRLLRDGYLIPASIKILPFHTGVYLNDGRTFVFKSLVGAQFSPSLFSGIFSLYRLVESQRH
jgi:hypothetical protein